MSLREVAPVGLDSFFAPIGGAAAALKRLREAAWAEVSAIGRNAVKAECGRGEYKSRGVADADQSLAQLPQARKKTSSHLIQHQRRSAEDIVPPSPFPMHAEGEKDIAAL